MPGDVPAVPIPENFQDDGQWLVQAIDPISRLARLVRLDSDALRTASFLDDRLLASKPETILCNLDQVIERADAVLSPPAGWIFHIGHVGSTLVSRLLGEIEGVRAPREPRSLRDLLASSDQERPVLAAALRRLMSRRSEQDIAVIVKATSFVSEFAPLLIEPGAAALFLFASPENYISGILAGDNSVKELAALEAIRAGRLANRQIRLAGFDRSDAHRAAAAWACEMTSLEAAAEVLPDSRILWADFDAVLADMAEWLSHVASHFGIEAASDHINAVSTGPLMRRYSKALEHDYSPSLRTELLDEARNRHLPQINEAIAALYEAAGSAPLLDRALKRAVGEI
jgi:hypothetical protein